MDSSLYPLLFALLRSAMGNSPLTAAERGLFSPDLVKPLANIANKHKIFPIVAAGLSNNGLVPDTADMLIIQSIHQYERRERLAGICYQVLEAAAIPYIPLKGAVIRALYPQPWMRSSCDIDILIPEDRVNEAAERLILEGFTISAQSSHDIQMLDTEGQHIELHYALIEEGIMGAAAKLLANVWDTAIPREGYRYDMTDGLFYIYHVAHMAKHILNGGCGIRPFIDLWLLDKQPETVPGERAHLLEEGGLAAFATVARLLGSLWFENTPSPYEKRQTVALLETFVLEGGSYGNRGNRVFVQQQKRGSRWNYALSRIFTSYDDLKYHYPLLQKHRCLMPFMQVHRWVNILIDGRAKNALGELKYNHALSDEKAAVMQNFLKELEL